MKPEDRKELRERAMVNRKPMVYGPRPEEFSADHIMVNVNHGDFRIVLVNYGVHPCGYVGILKGSRTHQAFGGLDYNQAYELIEPCVNWGFTFAQEKVSWDPTEKHYWFGWDYGHCNDYSMYESGPSHGRKWTTGEILDQALDCVDAFDKAMVGFGAQLKCKHMIQYDIETLDARCAKCGARWKWIRETSTERDE